MPPSTNLELFKPRELGSKEWGSEVLVAQTDQYIGKVLTMRAGTSGPLQYHQFKDETFHLWAGKAEVTMDIGGKLVTRPMRAGESYHVPPGAVHRVKAITPCIFFEASTPVFDDRVNCDDRYSGR